MRTHPDSDICCFRCKRNPEEINDYQDLVATGEYETAREAAEDDGTYNDETGHFCCIDCYIAIGTPSLPVELGGWKAP